MSLGLGKDANHGSATYWLQSCGRGASSNVCLVVGKTDGLTCGDLHRACKDLLMECQVFSPRGDPHGARTRRQRRLSSVRGCRARGLRHDLCDRALRWGTPDSAALENSDVFLGKSLNTASLCH